MNDVNYIYDGSPRTIISNKIDAEALEASILEHSQNSCRDYKIFQSIMDGEKLVRIAKEYDLTPKRIADIRNKIHCDYKLYLMRRDANSRKEQS